MAAPPLLGLGRALRRAPVAGCGRRPSTLQPWPPSCPSSSSTACPQPRPEAFACQRRDYGGGASGGHTADGEDDAARSYSALPPAVVRQLRALRTPGEALKFGVENEGADASTLEATLHRLRYLIPTYPSGAAAAAVRKGETSPALTDESRGGWTLERVKADGRFHVLVAALTSRLESCNGRALALSADAAARMSAPTPELRALLERAAEVALERENSFKPRHLTVLALALATHGVHALPAVVPVPGRGEVSAMRELGPAAAFVRAEAMRQMQEFNTSCCASLLEAFRRWGVYDRQLVDMALERIWDDFDAMQSRDAVELIAVLARLGLGRGPLLRRLAQLVFSRLDEFSTRQLVLILHSLARLRFLYRGDLDEVLEALLPNLGVLSNSKISNLLFSLAMCDAEHQASLARLLVVQYAEGRGDKDVASDIDVAWAMAALSLYERYPDVARRLLSRTFSGDVPKSRVALVKLHDVILAADLHGPPLSTIARSRWKAACGHAARDEARRLGASSVHEQVAAALGDLAFVEDPNQPLGRPFKVRRSWDVGWVPVDFFDQASGLALDVELVANPATRRIRHEVLRRKGIKPLRLDVWDWQAARGEAGRRALL
eukprot:CAMPEP_0203954370 /NCGR_PEP_ID=MMETSP0359-20131031/87427_1 /ASSEMBLY_ACC=CAM_ASM_000338 /TAXON_ID=268821 /ORGANISM="Scrippsiella Hangoei, Strain SHTV-5" /LENGTH=607 /DNA_ID=CAMNT_0050887897 /DNA_START=53 /DNA_END=1873 /DNA_ORIENTATION=+